MCRDQKRQPFTVDTTTDHKQRSRRRRCRRRQPRPRRRHREEKCENRKNYVLRTGCPVSKRISDFVPCCGISSSCSQLLNISAADSSVYYIGINSRFQAQKEEEEAECRSNVKWLIDFWKSPFFAPIKIAFNGQRLLLEVLEQSPWQAR